VPDLVRNVCEHSHIGTLKHGSVRLDDPLPDISIELVNASRDLVPIEFRFRHATKGTTKWILPLCNSEIRTEELPEEAAEGSDLGNERKCNGIGKESVSSASVS
jgi:hypothetical protein